MPAFPSTIIIPSHLRTSELKGSTPFFFERGFLSHRSYSLIFPFFPSFFFHSRPSFLFCPLFLVSHCLKIYLKNQCFHGTFTIFILPPAISSFHGIHCISPRYISHLPLPLPTSPLLNPLHYLPSLDTASPKRQSSLISVIRLSVFSCASCALNQISRR